MQLEVSQHPMQKTSNTDLTETSVRCLFRAAAEMMSSLADVAPIIILQSSRINV